jgi:transcriptional regulator with XRE-family HTH domain
MIDRLAEAIEKARDRRRLPPPATRRRVRMRAGVTQIDLALALGVDSATVCRWESGQRHPRGEMLHAYLTALERLEREWE